MWGDSFNSGDNTELYEQSRAVMYKSVFGMRIMLGEQYCMYYMAVHYIYLKVIKQVHSRGQRVSRKMSECDQKSVLSQLYYKMI